MSDHNPVPPKPDPADRPAVCRYAYSMIAARLLEWEIEFGLTDAEYLSVLARCLQDRLTAMQRSERFPAEGGGPMVPKAGRAGPAV